VQLSSAGSVDPEGDALSFEWDFDNDGSVDSTEPNPSITFDTNGTHAPTLRAIDSTGRSGVASTRVVVGNTPPVITFVSPAPGLPFEFGDTVAFEVVINDDGPVDCARVSVEEILLHEQHGHPLSTASGCKGTFTTQLDAGHAGAEGLLIALRAVYTDAPTAPGAPALTAEGFAILFPSDFPFEPEASPGSGDAETSPEANP
jgi:PKD repeat protein